MDKYYEWIIYYIGENYISKEKWQENLANIEKDYYEKVGLKHLNKILAIPDQNKKKIVSYVNSKNKNLDYDILETLKVVIERHPEYRETIEKVLNFFEKYRKDNDILNNIIVNGIELTPEDVIKMFISGEYKNREIFLKNLNITLNTFNKFLTIVAETNPALIDLYNEKFEGMNSKRFAILIGTIEKIIDGITNGIVDESGKQRKFELLDYFTSTRLPIDDFIKLAKENYLITPENARYIKQFAAKVKEARKVPHTHIYNEKLIMIIDGQPHEVTMEEKKLALEYMKIYNIDLYYGIYKSLLKKVAHGELTNESLEELKQEKFQKQTQQSDTDETSKKI